jgi:hypothetical protein
MQLPDDVLVIIRDYSKPLTRPDWRTLKPLSGHLLYTDIYKIIWTKHNVSSLYKHVFQYIRNTQWGHTYMIIRILGIHYASCHFNTPIDELYKMSGMEYAQDYYLDDNLY